MDVLHRSLGIAEDRRRPVGAGFHLENSGTGYLANQANKYTDRHPEKQEENTDGSVGFGTCDNTFSV
jgi:hypothetical protein